MSLRKTIEVVARLKANKVIANYAIAGAVAALNYVQPTLTEDLDILVSIDGFASGPSGLLLLTPIEDALARMGYTQRTDVGYLVEDWPVQFLPVGSALDEEALEQAVELNVAPAGEAPLMARSLRAEHVVATAAKLGRTKDLLRIETFLNQKAVDLSRLKSVLERHNLMNDWRVLLMKVGIKDPLAGVE